MTRLRTILISAAGLTLAATTLQAQDLSRYRDFQLGSTLASVARAGGVTVDDDVRVVHQRQATIQELRWRPRQGQYTSVTDPVREVVFSFYDDQLFQIAVDYDRRRTANLTNADVIEALSDWYGAPVLTASDQRISAPPGEIDGDTFVARWSGIESSVTLARGSYPASLRLVVALKRLETVTRNAAAEAARRTGQEPREPGRDREQLSALIGHVPGEKALLVNKPLFRP